MICERPQYRAESFRLIHAVMPETNGIHIKRVYLTNHLPESKPNSKRPLSPLSLSRYLVHHHQQVLLVYATLALPSHHQNSNSPGTTTTSLLPVLTLMSLTPSPSSSSKTPNNPPVPPSSAAFTNPQILPAHFLTFSPVSSSRAETTPSDRMILPVSRERTRREATVLRAERRERRAVRSASV